MPSWKFHITIGIIITTAMVYLCYYFGYGYFFVDNNQIQYFFAMQVGFVAVLGSVMPDFDYKKTRIRHAFGPVLGGFLIISYVYLYRFEPFTINPVFISVLLLVVVVVTFIAGLVIPFRHHGKLHSVSAAFIYALCWAGVEVFIFNLNAVQACIIGLFALFGFLSHLVLDRDLKLL